MNLPLLLNTILTTFKKNNGVYFLYVYLFFVFTFAIINYIFFRYDYTIATSFIDHLYYAGSVCTLVGFGDVHPKTHSTRLFVFFYISIIFILLNAAYISAF